MTKASGKDVNGLKKNTYIYAHNSTCVQWGMKLKTFCMPSNGKNSFWDIQHGHWIFTTSSPPFLPFSPSCQLFHTSWVTHFPTRTNFPKKSRPTDPIQAITGRLPVWKPINYSIALVFLEKPKTITTKSVVFHNNISVRLNKKINK